MKHAMKSIGEKWLSSLSLAVRTANMRREIRNEKTRNEVQSGAGACCGATRLANDPLLPVRGGVRTTPLAPAAESSRVPQAPVPVPARAWLPVLPPMPAWLSDDVDRPALSTRYLRLTISCRFKTTQIGHAFIVRPFIYAIFHPLLNGFHKRVKDSKSRL